LFDQDLSFDQLATYLFEEHNISVTGRTIQRRFRAWNIRKRQAAPEPTDELCKRVQILFFEVGLEDRDMLHLLNREGFNISKWHLVRLRFRLNLRRRIGNTQEDHDHADSVVEQLIKDELRHGQIEGYGRGLLHSHFRQQGYIVARDRLFRVYRTLNREAINRRKRVLPRPSGEAIIPGPNYVWSVDGYDKLKSYGIEIHACIDAYSRYIIWVYVGVSNATAISCLTQYLHVLEDFKTAPQFLRSDRGEETVMMAQAHYKLQRASDPTLELRDCYMYGTSKQNQQLENWWGQLSKGYLWRWRVRIIWIFIEDF
jgi:hypothetical protein